VVEAVISLKQTYIRAAGKVILAGLVCLIIGALFWGRQCRVKFFSGGEVRVKSASFFGSCFGSKCRVTYTGSSGSGDILLFDGRPEGPLLVIPSSNSDVFYCLYDFDVGLRLLKIETNAKFHPFSAKSPLNHIVLASPWQISDGTDSDWLVAEKYLTSLSQSQFKQQSLSGQGLFASGADKGELLSRMEWQASRPK